jgi:hypothetical protein
MGKQTEKFRVSLHEHSRSLRVGAIGGSGDGGGECH